MSSKDLNVKTVKSDSYVCFEFIRPFCTCGRELSSLYFELSLPIELFDEVMSKVTDDVEWASSMLMTTNKEEVFSSRDLKFCCRLSLQFGRSYPLSLEDPRAGVRRDQPPISLPGALNKRKGIYWSC